MAIPGDHQAELNRAGANVSSRWGSVACYIRRYPLGAIGALISNGCKFDASVMMILHQRYFRTPKEDDAVAELGQKITAELDSVLHILEAAGRDHSAYGKTLSHASGELGEAKLGAGAIKNLIDQVIGATRAMEARSKTLEVQLQTSSREVSELRVRLESVRRESLTDQLTDIPNRKA